MKLKLIALSLVLSAASTTSAFALDGGQVDFAGLVSDNTCTPHVNGGSQDGQVQLNTAVTANVASDPGVQDSEPGVQPEPFYITVDCGSSNANTKAHLSMAYTQVKVNDAADIHDATFDADGVAKFNFVVSYVRQSSAVPVTAGYVKSNTAYTLTYN